MTFRGTPGYSFFNTGKKEPSYRLESKTLPAYYMEHTNSIFRHFIHFLISLLVVTTCISISLNSYAFNLDINLPVRDIAVQADGKVVIAGGFTVVDGLHRKNVVRLNTDCSVDSEFDPDVQELNPGAGNGGVTAMAVQTNGKVIISGFFNELGHTQSHYIARLNTDGSIDTGFDPISVSINSVDDLVVQADGKVLVFGQFDEISDVPRNSIARLNIDGSVDTGFDSGLPSGSRVQAVTVQADGKIIIGGEFDEVSGVARNRLARLNTDGSVDIGFDPGLGVTNVRTIAVHVDGKVMIGGGFEEVNGVARNGIARLNTDGSIDTGFNPTASPRQLVDDLALQVDGQVVFLNSYDTITRLNIDGSFDAEFDLLRIGEIDVLAVQTDNKIIIGGNFNRVNDLKNDRVVTRDRLTRLKPNGWLDDDCDETCYPVKASNGNISLFCI